MENMVNPYHPTELAASTEPPRAFCYQPGGAKATAAVVTLYIAAASELLLVAARTSSLVVGGRPELIPLLLGACALSVLAFPACAIAFCIWFHHAYRNVGCLGGIPTYAPGWAPGSFFVPFLNLYRPYQIAKEIWLASMPIEDDRPGHLPVTLWWGLFLGGRIIASVATFRTDGEASVATSTPLLIVAGLLSTAAALLAARLVRRVEKRQAACLHVGE